MEPSKEMVHDYVRRCVMARAAEYTHRVIDRRDVTVESYALDYRETCLPEFVGVVRHGPGLLHPSATVLLNVIARVFVQMETFSLEGIVIPNGFESDERWRVISNVSDEVIKCHGLAFLSMREALYWREDLLMAA